MSLQTKTKPRTTRNCRRSEIKFPGRLHDLLEYVESENLDHIVAWVNDGTAFQVCMPQEMLRLLSIFFGQTQYRSFTRQLNAWHFKRVMTGPFKGAFFHPYFQKDDKALCTKMTQREPPRHDRADNEDEEAKSSESSDNDDHEATAVGSAQSLYSSRPSSNILPLDSKQLLTGENDTNAVLLRSPRALPLDEQSRKSSTSTVLWPSKAAPYGDLQSFTTVGASSSHVSLVEKQATEGHHAVGVEWGRGVEALKHSHRSSSFPRQFPSKVDYQHLNYHDHISRPQNNTEAAVVMPPARPIPWTHPPPTRLLSPSSTDWWYKTEEVALPPRGADLHPRSFNHTGSPALHASTPTVGSFNIPQEEEEVSPEEQLDNPAFSFVHAGDAALLEPVPIREVREGPGFYSVNSSSSLVLASSFNANNLVMTTARTTAPQTLRSHDENMYDPLVVTRLHDGEDDLNPLRIFLEQQQQDDDDDE